MKVKNYSSGVPIDRSLMQIEKLLIDLGATNISKAINEQKKVEGIIFMVAIENEPTLFKLKARTDQVFKTMWKEVSPRSIHKEETKKRIMEQAERTAWKLLFDRVAMDATDILLGNMELMEIFLTRAYDMKRNMTYYEIAKESGFKRLTSGEK